MTVTTSKKFNNLADHSDEIIDAMAEYLMLRMLTHYVPRDFVEKPWPTTLSPQYARRKARAGLPPIGNLRFSGNLAEALMSDAPQSLKVEKGVATAIVKSPYAATHQFGDLSRNIVQREFVRFDAHRKALIADLKKEFDKLVADV